MLKKVLIGIGVLVVAFCAIGLLLPSKVHVERSIVIDRPAATVFAVLDDFAQFNSWSPWAALDPEARYEYSGPRAGVGAKLAWSGNKAVGSGTMTITADTPDRSIEVALEFSDFGASHSSFTLAPAAAGVRVTWAYDGELGMNPLMRWMGLTMDGYAGADYERGLSKMKEVIERLPATDFAGLVAAPATTPVFTLASVPVATTTDSRDFFPAYDKARAALEAFVKKTKAQRAAAPHSLVRVTTFDRSADKLEFAVGVPLEGDAPAAAGEVGIGLSAAEPAIKVTHRGSFASIGAEHERIQAYLAAHRIERAGPMLEVYATDPEAPDDALVTDIYYLVR